MIIGIPNEIKKDEYRVSLPPDAAHLLVQRGHTVLVETNAGIGSGFTNDEYEAAGAVVRWSADEVWNSSEMVVKVKEPLESEFGYLRADLTLFTYLHLAANEKLTRAMLNSGVTGIAYETVTDHHGRLPLLEPMSEVAGRMAAQVVAHYLEKHAGGRGI